MKLNRIKDTLEEKGISQTWLAKQLGKSFSALRRQEAAVARGAVAVVEQEQRAAVRLRADDAAGGLQHLSLIHI